MKSEKNIDTIEEKEKKHFLSLVGGKDWGKRRGTGEGEEEYTRFLALSSRSSPSSLQGNMMEDTALESLREKGYELGGFLGRGAFSEVLIFSLFFRVFFGRRKKILFFSLPSQSTTTTTKTNYLNRS